MLVPISSAILVSTTQPMKRDVNTKIASHATLMLKRFMSSVVRKDRAVGSDRQRE